MPFPARQHTRPALAGQQNKKPPAACMRTAGGPGDDAFPTGTWWPERCGKAKVWEESREV